MELHATIFVLGKFIKTSKAGKDYHYINYSQKDGQIIGQLFVPADVYPLIVDGQSVDLVLRSGDYNGKFYIRVIGLA